MAVFDGSVKTPRRVADPITDKQVSSVASLTLISIDTPAALLYPGSDVSVVHGNQQLHVDQNRIMKVDMNQDVTIGMNEIYLIDMNRTMTVMGNYSRTVMVNSTISVTGNYVKSVLSDYTKTITGISTNTIFSDYIKTVHADYTKTINGSSGNTIIGSYTKTIQSDYTKQITGTSTNKVTGDYSKLLSANYVKVVTGNSNVQVTSESVAQYIGNHSRTFGNDHKMYISGSNTHTTVGPTIRTEIDVAVTQQIDNHVDTHPSDLNQEKNNWFTVTTNKGQYQRALKIDYTSGLILSGSLLKMDSNILNYGFHGSHNTFFIDKFDCGGFKNEALATKTKINGVSVRIAAVACKVAASTNKACAATVHAGGTGIKVLGGIFQAVPGKVQAGVTWAINQFM